jgi:hypothetical protein
VLKELVQEPVPVPPKPTHSVETSEAVVPIAAPAKPRKAGAAKGKVRSAGAKRKEPKAVAAKAKEPKVKSSKRKGKAGRS